MPRQRKLPTVDEEPLPPLYQRWMRAALPSYLPRETRATCDSCVMVSPRGTEARAPFNSLVKCCTYLPELPNFLVGGVLLDDSPDTTSRAGARTMRERIARGTEVNPLGLRRTPVYGAVYERVEGTAFGRSPALQCLHYIAEEGGRCGLWRYRNSVCATWFCQHVRGKHGFDMWHQVKLLLRAVEDELSLWCCLEIGGTNMLGRALAQQDRAPRLALIDELVAEAHDPQHARLWGEWAGQEEAYYRRAWELVAPLSWEQVLGLCGQRVRAHQEVLSRTLERLVEGVIPDILVPATVSAEPVDGQQVRVFSYSQNDPVTIPQVVWQQLRSFDGRHRDEVLATLTSDLKAAFAQPGLLQKLVDYGILSEPDRARSLPDPSPYRQGNP